MSTEQIIDLKFRSCKLSDEHTKDYHFRNKIKFQLINTSDKVIDIKQFSLFGKKKTKYYYFSDTGYSLPQHLNRWEADDAWIIIQDDAFSCLENCEQLYLIAQISDGIEDNKFIFGIKSPDYSAEEWDIVYRRKYVSSMSNEDVLKNISNDNITIKKVHETKFKFYHEYIITNNNKENFTDNGILNKKKELRGKFNNINFSIIKSEIANSTSGDKCFWILIEAENNDDEDYLITYNNFILLDQDSTIMRYNGYRTGMKPIDTPLYVNCKDKFEIVFDANKCFDESESFDLKFDVSTIGYEEILQIGFHTNDFGGKWDCISKKLIPPRLSPEETAIEKRRSLIEKNSMPEIKCFEQSFNIKFKNLSFTKDSCDDLKIYGFIESTFIYEECTLVAFNLRNKILGMEKIYFYDKRKKNSWYPFEVIFNNCKFQKVNKIEVYVK